MTVGGLRDTYCEAGDECLEQDRCGQHDRLLAMLVLFLGSLINNLDINKPLIPESVTVERNPPKEQLQI